MDMIEGSSCNNAVVKHLQYQLSGAHEGGKWPSFFVVPTVGDGLKQKMSMSTLLLKGTRLYLLKTEASWDCRIHQVEARVFIVRSICYSSMSQSFTIFRIQVKKST